YPVLADERVITTNGSPPRAVSDLTLAELATVRTDIEHRVPTLMEVLAEFPTRDVQALLVEADTPEAALATDTLLRERGFADRLLFTGPVEVLNALRGRSTRAHLLLPWEQPGPPPDDLTHTLRPTFLGTHHTLLNRELVEDLQHRGFRVAAWAVNEYSEMARLAGMGVDAAATDRPAELASLTHGREQGDLMAPAPAWAARLSGTCSRTRPGSTCKECTEVDRVRQGVESGVSGVQVVPRVVLGQQAGGVLRIAKHRVEVPDPVEDRVRKVDLLPQEGIDVLAGLVDLGRASPVTSAGSECVRIHRHVVRAGGLGHLGEPA